VGIRENQTAVQDFICTELELFSCNSRIPPKHMVLLWSHCGPTVVLLWSYCGPTVVLLAQCGPQPVCAYSKIVMAHARHREMYMHVQNPYVC
jgi:hypothetical protein